MGAYQRVPAETWSQMMDQIPGQGVAASTGGPNTPGTATTEVPEQGAPPPGLPLPDFTSWNLPPPEVPPTRGPLPSSVGQPGLRILDVMRQVAGPQAPGQQAPVPPMMLPCAPQVAPPLHQP